MKDKNIAKKEKAIELLKEMDIYAPYIKGFCEKGMVCFFERFGGYWAEQEPELYEKMKALEKKYNCLVYAITHEYTDFGECYSFLRQQTYRLCLRLEQRRRLVQRVRQHYGAELRRRYQKNCVTRRNGYERIRLQDNGTHPLSERRDGRDHRT